MKGSCKSLVGLLFTSVNKVWEYNLFKVNHVTCMLYVISHLYCPYNILQIKIKHTSYQFS